MPPGPPLLTLRDAVRLTAEHLAARGVGSPRLDAELLVGDAVGMDRLQVFLNLDRPLDAAERDRARERLRRRAAREPVAYILGRREFYGRGFAVDKRVLIPRPETEFLVEHALEELALRFPAESSAGAAFNLLEVGVGSGAVAVTLALELPAARVVATEASQGAAEVARANAAAHGAADRVDVLVQDDLSGLAARGPFHAIVSNPPYIDPADRESLMPEVRDYEPAVALFAEDSGYEVIRMLMAGAAALLAPGGFLMMEVGAGQAARTVGMGAAAGLPDGQVWKDYAGIERIVRLAAEPASAAAPEMP